MALPEAIRTSALRQSVTDGTVSSRAAILVLLLSSDTGSLQVMLIAETLAMSIPRVSMLGATLEKQGLIDRCVPVSDMRKVSLALNQQGYETAKRHAANLQALIGGAADA